jgi:GTP pyrophosphokinase
LDLFYRVGVINWQSTIERLCRPKSNTLINFKSKIKRSGPTADADVHKQVLSIIRYAVFGKEQDKLDKLSTCCNPIPGDPSLVLLP